MLKLPKLGLSKLLAGTWKSFTRQQSTSGFDYSKAFDIDCSKLQTIKYSVKDRVAHILLNRPDRMNAIDGILPIELQSAIEASNYDSSVKVILISGSNNTFCAGYDLKLLAESPRGSSVCNQTMPWDPYLDYMVAGKCHQCIMSIWRSPKPVISKIRGVALGGGTDIALTSDITFIADEAQIGYPPARVWGCPSTAMWVHRVGIEKAKRLLFTGDVLTGKQAAEIGLIGESVPDEVLDEVVQKFIDRIITVPSNQFFFQKQVINNAVEMMGLSTSQLLSTLFDGMTRHSPEGVAFQQQAQKFGFKKAVQARNSGQETEWSNMNVGDEKD